MSGSICHSCFSNESIAFCCCIQISICENCFKLHNRIGEHYILKDEYQLNSVIELSMYESSEEEKEEINEESFMFNRNILLDSINELIESLKKQSQKDKEKVIQQFKEFIKCLDLAQPIFILMDSLVIP